MSATVGGLLAAFAPLPVPIRASAAAEFEPSPAGEIWWSLAEHPEIEAMVGPIRRVMTFNATAFPGRSGPVFGFNAGQLYPQVFARDFGTISEFAGFLFGAEYLRTPVEEFLATQDEFDSPELEGAVPATISVRGEVDKATASSDEETSIVNAAYSYFVTGGGPEWLRSAVAGEPVISRLNRAVGYVIRARRDPESGLVFRAHTSDWGDVKIEGGDAPTDLLPGDARTASIFDQALTYQAMRQLERMNGAAEDPEAAAQWRREAESLRDAADARLWNPARGFYRLHTHLTPLTHAFDEDAMVGLGNVAALRSGLAPEDRAQSIIHQLGQAALAAGTKRAGLSLWPPYPVGVFNHPSMWPATYQNGGVWDWWAGSQILAEFECGASDRALDHLLESANHWRGTGNVPEWFHLPTASDQGSQEFTGAAGTLGLAVVRGLFGLRIEGDRMSLTSRLGAKQGGFGARHPATGMEVELSQRTGPDWIALDVKSAGHAVGAFSARLPSGWPDALVLVDDQATAAGVETRMDDVTTKEVEFFPGRHAFAVLRLGSGDPREAWRTGYGAFYETGGGLGFWITNASGVGLYDGYKRLGGVDRLGPPISGRFSLEGSMAQAVQRAVLVWDPALTRAVPASTLSLLSKAGLDQWLESRHGIPAAGAQELSILDREPALKSAFLTYPDWNEAFGLPVAMAEREAMVVLRTEKTALQLWKVATAWGAVPGDVTLVNAGSIALEAGVVPEMAMTPVAGVPPIAGQGGG